MSQASVNMLRFRAMGSEVRAISPGALEWLPSWFEAHESRASRFRPDSELTRLNRHGGDPQPVSRELYRAIQLALEVAHETGGLVVPTLLDALEHAGYDRSFEQLPECSPAQANAAPRTDSWRSIELREDTQEVRLPRGARLDLAGTVKGRAADDAVARLPRGSLVDVGGDVAANGPPDGDRGWPVGIADPLDPDRLVELVRLERGGVATSGRDFRCWKRGDRLQHHLIDPRTATPAETDLLTASVVGPSVAEADVAAKVLLILGSQAGMPWLEQRPSLAALAVRDDGEVLFSSRFGRHVWS